MKNNAHGYPSDPPPHPANEGEKELLEIPNISSEMQLNRNIINPKVNSEPRPLPPVETESNLIISSALRSGDMGKNVKIDLDNGIPAGQELTSVEQKGGGNPVNRHGQHRYSKAAQGGQV